MSGSSEQGLILTGTKVDRLIELIEKYCTNAPVHDLFRKFKTKENKLKIGGNREDLLVRLKAAVINRHVPASEVVDLLRRSEENGRQHIALFQFKGNKTDRDKLLDPEHIGIQLFGDNWKSRMKFPKFALEPTGEVWADLRAENSPATKQKSLVLKVYRGEYVRHRVKTERIDDTTTIETWKDKLEREILVFRFLGNGYFEMRTPLTSAGSDKHYKESVSNAWDTIELAFDRSRFQAINLRPVLKSLRDEAESRRDLYVLSNTKFTVSQKGTVSCEVRNTNESILDNPEMKAALPHLHDVAQTTVVWLKKGDTYKRIDTDVRTDWCNRSDNEYKIGRQVSPSAVDYVASQIQNRLK